MFHNHIGMYSFQINKLHFLFSVQCSIKYMFSIICVPPLATITQDNQQYTVQGIYSSGSKK